MNPHVSIVNQNGILTQVGLQILYVCVWRLIAASEHAELIV